MSLAIVHDYLTQRGGAERVVLSMNRAFPDAPIHTSLYEPSATFPEFGAVHLQTLPLDRIGVLRHHHRLAFPLLAPAFSNLTVEAETVLCSSSGWAHGARCAGRKVVYCYTPARWIYQIDRYAGDRRAMKAAALAGRPFLRRWDQRAAATADRYLAISTAVRERIRRCYHRDATVLPPPRTLDPSGSREEVPGVAPGYFLCVSRLLPYKNVMPIAEAFASLPGERLVVVGSGPGEARLRASQTRNLALLSSVTDAQLRWLYAHSEGVVAAAYEDYGLTPLEGAAFGKPSAVLRWGGFLDTVVEGETGVFFSEPEPELIRAAVRRLSTEVFDPNALERRAAASSEENFIQGLRAVLGAEFERPSTGTPPTSEAC